MTLSVSQGGKEIGREEFTLTQGRGRGAPGTTLTATARYPATGPTKRLTASWSGRRSSPSRSSSSTSRAPRAPP